MRSIRIWRGPLVVFCAFIILVELILLWPWDRWDNLVRLDAGDLTSLLTGAIAAAGVTGIYRQFRQSRREAALRLDELHAAFNSPEMQVHRDLAWPYLHGLVDHADDEAAMREDGTPLASPRLTALARWWVRLEGNAPRAPGRLDEGTTRKAHDAKHIWAITAIINFYVRLENHLALHDGEETIASDEFLQAVGPFVWPYWERDILAFVAACTIEHQAALSERDAGTDGPERRLVTPYFIAPLNQLKKRYDDALSNIAPPTQ